MLTENRFLDTFRGHNVRPKLSRLKYMDPLHSLSPFPKGSSQFGHFAQQVHLTADKLEMRYCDRNPMCLQILHIHGCVLRTIT